MAMMVPASNNIRNKSKTHYTYTGFGFWHPLIALLFEEGTAPTTPIHLYNFMFNLLIKEIIFNRKSNKIYKKKKFKDKCRVVDTEKSYSFLIKTVTPRYCK